MICTRAAGCDTSCGRMRYSDGPGAASSASACVMLFVRYVRPKLGTLPYSRCCRYSPCTSMIVFLQHATRNTQRGQARRSVGARRHLPNVLAAGGLLEAERVVDVARLAVLLPQDDGFYTAQRTAAVRRGGRPTAADATTYLPASRTGLRTVSSTPRYTSLSRPHWRCTTPGRPARSRSAPARGRRRGRSSSQCSRARRASHANHASFLVRHGCFPCFLSHTPPRRSRSTVHLRFKREMSNAQRAKFHATPDLHCRRLQSVAVLR